MEFDELITAARKMAVTEAQIQSMQQRLKEKEKALEAQARTQAVNQEFLARTYSL